MGHAKLGVGITAIFAAFAAFACGAPTPPPQQSPVFECGKKTCDATTSYCERQLSDVPSAQNIDACKPLPGPCRAARDCGCFPIDTPCVMFKQCSAVPAGDRVGLTMTCPGG